MLDPQVKRLVDYLRELKQVVIAYSGGVDSTLLLRLSVDTLGKENVRAVTVLSSLLPPWDYEFARKFTRTLGLKLILLSGLEKLKEENFIKNDAYRCYHCKKFNYKLIRGKFPDFHILSGTNASDTSDFRPGIKAEKDEGVKTPFLDLGITKEDIREISRFLGIPGAERPASACLASRVLTGEIITEEKLKKIKEAELTLKELGISGVLRVRIMGNDIAKIETEIDQLRKVLLYRKDILRELKNIGFRKIFLDIEGYEPSGKFLKEAQQ